MANIVPLWPNGAPGALGNAPADTPSVELHLLDGEPRAVVVVCPGGGYNRLAPHEGAPVAQWLNSIGVSALVLHYRVAPYRYPSALLDAQRAIRLARHHALEWGIDPQRVGILGFSAGGHLASTAGTHFDAGNSAAPDLVDRLSSRPDFMILCYPVITFREPYAHKGSMKNQLGPTPTEQMLDLLSNEMQVTAQTPPAFIWHTVDDPVVPVENSLLFADALRKSGVSFELHCFASGRHGMGLAAEHPSAQAWPSLCAAWLRQMGVVG